MNKFLTLLKKDLKRMFTDKRILMSIFLPGLLIFAIYTFMGKAMSSVFTKQATKYTIGIVNEPVEFSAFTSDEIQEELGWEITYILDTTTKTDALEKVKNKEIDCYIVYPENFKEMIDAYKADHSKECPNVEIYYNSTKTSSSQFYSYYSNCLNSYEASINNMFDVNAGATKYNLASSKEETGQMLAMIVPFLLIMFLYSGSMGICADAVAGEKERGTIATLLVTPTKRSHIAFAKICSLSVTALASSIVSAIGMVAALPSLMGGAGSFDLSSYGIGTIALLILVIIFTSLLITTFLSILSTIAKTTKEATSLSIVPMFIIMGLGITSMMSQTASSNALLYLIPIYNSVQCFNGIFTSSVTPLCYILTLISNATVIALGVFAMSKMFNSEKIMFNK